MAVHRLKTWCEPFDAIRMGLKGFEYRSDRDRTFEDGDLLCLEEYDHELSRLTGNALWRVVTFVLRGPAFGVPEGYSVLSIAPLASAPILGIEIDPSDRRNMIRVEAAAWRKRP